jgi:hypothetical protein
MGCAASSDMGKVGEMQTPRQRKIKRVMDLFKRAVPAGELDKDDWDSLRVSIRLVYETEELRVLLHGKRRIRRDAAILDWSNSVEACLEFLSWTKCLASIVQDRTYAKERRAYGVEDSWDLHAERAKQLKDPKISANRRISILAELGGIELSILGHLWWLEASHEPPAPREPAGKRRKAQATRVPR